MNAWQCPSCGHQSRFGGLPAFTLHTKVTHGDAPRITST